VDTSSLPGSLASAPVSFGTVGQGSAAVTFNSNAPSKLQGTTLTMQYGPGEVAVYGNVAQAISQASRAGGSAGASADSSAAATKAASGEEGSGATSQQQFRQALAAIGPVVGVAEMRAPKVSSNGASLQDIKDTLLA